MCFVVRVGKQFMKLSCHNRTYKEAQSFMDSTVLFNRAGWKAVMGIEK